MSRQLWLVFASGALGVTACSFLVEPEAAQCGTTSDCAARRGAFADTVCLDGFCREGSGLGAGAGGSPDAGGSSGAGGGGGSAGAAPAVPPEWACIDAPPPEPTVPPEVSVLLAFEAYGTKQKVAGLRLNACRRLDAACATPLSSLVSDAEGRATFRLPTGSNGAGGPKGFAGFVEVRGPEGEGADGALPLLIFFHPDLVADEVERPYIDITVFRRSEFAALVQLAAGEYDATRGHVILGAQGCDASAAAGVHYEADKADGTMAAFYMASGLPSTSARSTDASGIGGFVKAPVGFLTITGTVWDDAYGGPVGTIGEVQVVTRPDWGTVTRLGPAALVRR